MPTAFVVAWLLPAAVLAFAGVGHLLRGHQSMSVFLDSISLTVPASVLRAHPYVECLVALGLLGGTGALQVVSSACAVLLFATYLALVVRAIRRPDAEGCGCFDDGRDPVTRRTVLRNTLLLACVLAAAVGAAGGHSPRGLLDASGWWWALAAVVVALFGWSLQAHGAGGPMRTPGGAPTVLDDGDYVRHPIPMAWLSGSASAAGTSRVTLRELAAQRPQLLLFLSVGCSSCRQVAQSLPKWVGRLTELDIVAVQQAPAPDFPIPGVDVLYDADLTASRILGTSGPPSAVLLGADGKLAGGPVHGPTEIEAFLASIRAELDAS